jgi:hypothetical protein
MSLSCQRILRAVFAATLASSALAPAQTLSIGIGLVYAGNDSRQGIRTILDTEATANLDGQLTTAVFEWSASPCPAAVKIKIFRPSASLFFLDFTLPDSFSFVAERGPFDVTAPVLGGTYAFQVVTLSPPVDVQAGDVIAITRLTTCGGPVFQEPPRPFFCCPPGGSFSVPGDVTSSVSNPRSFDPWVGISATGNTTEFGLLRGRFVTSLVATDPRTGVTSQGVPNALHDGAGFFSLPAFTGDPRFPEVMVKMVDATGSPALGGDFWFFHAPLTDVQYTLTVKDQTTGVIRTYSNTSGSPAQLCGGVDTSAFQGP